MAGSTIGNMIKMTTWGESHGKAIGVVLDGFPAGMELSEEDIQPYLNRRRPGQNAASTPRKEADQVEILSGVFEGKTTGTPISMIVHNTSQHSADYSQIAEYYRPGHADFGYDQKFGFRDYRGGGRSSGRETIGRVAAGAVCAKLLGQMDITVTAYAASIGPIHADPSKFSREQILLSPTGMPDAEADQAAMDYIAKCRAEKDSVGGTIECRIHGVPAGIGEPTFDKLDARFAGALMGIGAVKAVEIGDGVKVSTALGSENNDAFTPQGKSTNHSGGILGGMSDGSEIFLRAHIKPTPSISKTQETINNKGESIEIQIGGRHDPVIVPRAVVVVECMCAFTLLDAMLSNLASKASSVIDFYKK